MKLFRRTLLLTPEMELTAVLEREIERALMERKRMRAKGFVRPYRRVGR